MNTTKKLLNIVSLLSVGGCAQADFFDQMHHVIEDMRNMSINMQSMNSNFNNMIQPGTKNPLDIRFEEPKKDGTHAIQIEGILTDNIEASYDEKQNILRIKTDFETIEVQPFGTYISVSLSQEIEKKENTQNSQSQMTSYSRSNCTVGNTVEFPLNFELSTIDYDKETQLLTVNLPRLTEKIIPVTIKEKVAQVQTDIQEK